MNQTNLTAEKSEQKNNKEQENTNQELTSYEKITKHLEKQYENF